MPVEAVREERGRVKGEFASPFRKVISRREILRDGSCHHADGEGGNGEITPIILTRGHGELGA